MDKWEAVEGLQKIMDRWMDFCEWAMNQLVLRGEYTLERHKEVLANHDRAIKRLEEFQKKDQQKMKELEEAGASKEEYMEYYKVSLDERCEAHHAYSTLEGLPE